MVGSAYKIESSKRKIFDCSYACVGIPMLLELLSSLISFPSIN
jgi:hypothetical protein